MNDQDFTWISRGEYINIYNANAFSPYKLDDGVAYGLDNSTKPARLIRSRIWAAPNANCICSDGGHPHIVSSSGWIPANRWECSRCGGNQYKQAAY